MNWKNMKSELSNVLDYNKDIFIIKRKNLKTKLFFATIAIIYLCALFVSVPNNVSADTVTDTITGATPEEAFKNLQNKIDNKTINGDSKYELTLETDVNVNPTSSTAPIRLNGSRRTGKVEYIIDLNGHNINYTGTGTLSTGIFQIVSNASNVSLTIKDSTSEGTTPQHGIFNNTTRNCRAVDASSIIGGEVNIENIRVENFINGVGGSMRIIAQQNADPVSVNIKNSIFRNNNSNYGGGAIALNRTDATLEGNIIEGNSTSANNPKSGGGILAEYSNLTLTNNVISGNTANNGGGLYISVDASSNVRDYTIKLSGNKINNNSAVVTSGNSGGLGGGIEFSLSGNVKVNFTIESGEFIGNHAVEGGAIYHGVEWTDANSNLVLHNALITGNQAVRGAGIWLCPKAKTLMYSTLGGAIYGNTASGQHTTSRQTLDATGDDIRYEGTNGDDLQYSTPLDRTVLTVSDRTWNGFLVDWYKDEVGKRFSEGNRELADSTYYTNTKNAASLHGEINDAAKSALNSEATLIIKDNVASGRGGGIFSNNVVQIGENDDASLDVTKKFQKNGEDYEGETLLPEKVVVDLYRSDSDGNNKVKVEENVELNKDNNWHHTFEDLPSYAENAKGRVDYVYSVEEQDLTNFVKEKHNYEDGQKHYTYTLTNEVFALPVKYKINVKKIISGKLPFSNEEFTFKLSTEDTQGVILPDDLTAKVTGEGTTEFKDITFTKPGTYKFSVVEEKGNNEEYTYDEAVYEVKIKISEDSDGEHLKVEDVEITKDKKSTDEIVFINKFNPKDKPFYVDIVNNPYTSDGIMMYFFLLASAIIGSFAIIIREYCFKK